MDGDLIAPNISEVLPEPDIQQQALAEVARLIHSGLPLEEMLQTAVEKTRQLIGAKLAVLSLTATRHQVFPVTAVSYSGNTPLEQAFIEQLEGFGLSSEVCLSNRAVRLDGAALLARLHWKDAELISKGWMGAPLTQHDRSNMGIIQLVGPEAGQFTPNQESILLQLAYMTSLAAENDALDHAEQRSRQTTETLRAASLALNQALNRDAVLDTLLDYIAWIIPYDSATVFLLDGNKNLSARAIRNFGPEAIETGQFNISWVDIKSNHTLAPLFKNLKCVLVPDTLEQPIWERHIGGEPHSWLGVPLISEGKLLGICTVEKSTPEAFNEEHQRLAEALATQAAVAIQNASLFEALLASEERYRAATELASDFAYTFKVEPNGIFTREWVTDAFTRITGYAPSEVETLDGWVSLTHPDDVRLSIRHRQKLLSGQRSECEFRIVTKKGETRWLHDHSQPIWEKEQQRVVRVYGAAQDITQRKQHECELEAMAAIASALRTASTEADMLPVILDQTLSLLNAEGSAIALRDPLTSENAIALGRGEWAGWNNLRLPMSEGITGAVVDSGKIYVNNDAVKDPKRGRDEQIGNLHSVACVPLIARDLTIGALWVGRRNAMLNSEVQLLNAIADMAANAIRRASLHEQTERRLQHLIALRSIDRAITSSLDLKVTLNILLDQVVSQLGVNAADIFLYDTITQSLNFTVGQGFRSSAVANLELALGEGYAGRAAMERASIHIADLAGSDPAFLNSPALVGEGFVSYHCLPLIAKGQIKGVMEVFQRIPYIPDAEWLDFLETMAGQAAIAVENAQLFDGLQRTNERLMLAYDATIEGWSRALELRDKETEGHSRRVTELTLRLARALEMSETELVQVRRGALLHDIGKMGIPDSILLRPGPLSEEEWSVMRLHPQYAYDMLLPITYLRPALDIPYCHHEKWDGHGYPRGLKGEQIPLSARIFAIADVWDALNSDRPYGRAWPRQKVCEYILQESGKSFDPRVVDAFMKLNGCGIND